MRVTIVGSGYVGLVAGACFAETGNDVVCADLDEGKIEGLRRNEMPIYEPGLEPLVRRNQEEGRLAFTTDIGAAVERAQVVFIAVGTPEGEDGSADLQHVLDVARVIGRHLNGPKVIATKSTVPVGTAERVREVIRAESTESFSVCANPEFLKEGAAVEDFMHPDRVVVGVEDDRAREAMAQLYGPFFRKSDRILFMDIPSAEITKYAANAMLATRISFMNQIANLCELVGADVTSVRRGIGTDQRIGPAFLFPGPGYGGACFPKDVKALIRTARDADASADLFEAIETVNQRQKQVLLRKVDSAFGGALAGKTVALWGLAFKAETDDVRESPAIPLVEGLLARGARVVAHDPHAMENARRYFGDRIDYAADPYAAARGADALVVVTEWLVYRNPDFDRLLKEMAGRVLVDGRNLYDAARLRGLGFSYASIGRP
ncbi:MAG: UDP-glucose/GDP-mannose dehydrogenase family protein [Gemmatimonadales bacterium]